MLGQGLVIDDGGLSTTGWPAHGGAAQPPRWTVRARGGRSLHTLQDELVCSEDGSDNLRELPGHRQGLRRQTMPS